MHTYTHAHTHHRLTYTHPPHTHMHTPTTHSHAHTNSYTSPQLTCNTFSVFSSDLSEVGVALYPTASLFNHSCQPNTVAVFSGTRLSLRTVRPVFLGEQLFISYIETFQLKSERQAELQLQYHFTCGCERCDADESKRPVSVSVSVCGCECECVCKCGYEGDESRQPVLTGGPPPPGLHRQAAADGC